MKPTPDEIKALKAGLEERKGERRELKLSDPFYAQQRLAFTEEIAEMEKRLNIYLTSQQGNFSSRSSIALSQYSRCNPLPKSLSTSPLHPFRFGNYSR